MKMKRLIATALAAAMIFGLVSVGLAASLPDVEGYEWEKEVRRLADLGIIDGYEDGSFKPENTVKRSEFAKMIVCMLGLKNAANLMEGEQVPFSDVASSHWASGYINVAEMKGIVNGYPDGSFKPDATITHAEALKMVLTAMGYLEEGFLVVRWPATWVIQATEIELDKGLEVLANLPITRGEVAKLFDNSLTKEHVVIKEGEFVEREPEVTFMDKLGVKYLAGSVVESPELWSDEKGKVVVQGKNQDDIAETLNFTIDDYEGLLGNKVKVWHKGEKNVLGVEVVSTEKTLTQKQYKDIKEADRKKLNFFYNYVVGSFEDHDGEVKKADEIVVVYDGSTPVAVKALKYETRVVDETYKYGKRLDIYFEGQNSLDLYDWDVEYQGAVDAFDDIKKGDVVHYIAQPDHDRALIIVVRDTVEGRLTEVTFDGDLKVDGKTYEGIDGYVVDDGDGGDIDGLIGDIVTLYFNKEGKVYKVALTEAATAEEIFGGVIQAIARRWDKDKDDYVRFAKVLTADGEIEIELGESETELKVGDFVYREADEHLKALEMHGAEALEVSTVTKNAVKLVSNGKYDYEEETLWLEGKDKAPYKTRTKPYKGDWVKLYIVENEELVRVGLIYQEDPNPEEP